MRDDVKTNAMFGDVAIPFIALATQSAGLSSPLVYAVLTAGSERKIASVKYFNRRHVPDARALSAADIYDSIDSIISDDSRSISFPFSSTFLRFHILR